MPGKAAEEGVVTQGPEQRQIERHGAGNAQHVKGLGIIAHQQCARFTRRPPEALLSDRDLMSQKCRCDICIQQTELIGCRDGEARIRRVVDDHAVQDRVGPACKRADPSVTVVVADLDSGLAVGAAVVPGGHIYRLEVAGAEIELPRDLYVPGYLRQIARYGYPRPTPVGALP